MILPSARGPQVPTDEVQSITSAQVSLTDDLARRQHRYLVQMSIRVVCFVGAAVTWDHVPVWISVVLLVAATVLPYVAVLLANAGRERVGDGPAPVTLRELPASPAARRPGDLR